jgi:hypothetical protein
MKIKAQQLRQIIREELQLDQARRIIREAAGGNAIDVVAACMDRIRGGRADEREIERCVSDLSGKYPQGRDTIQKIDGQLRVLSHERSLMDDDIGSMNIDRLQGAERQLPALTVQLMR